MLMGPVFHAELLRTSRQRRYYALRLIYGLILLGLVWTGYEQVRGIRPVMSTAEFAAFAMGTFTSFGVVQLITVLLLVPPLFGGAIADEKQRKTLHYIMASRLSSGEIILDKVLGRSSLLMVFVAIGLPVVSILSLFGGISTDGSTARRSRNLPSFTPAPPRPWRRQRYDDRALLRNVYNTGASPPGSPWVN